MSFYAQSSSLSSISPSAISAASSLSLSCASATLLSSALCPFSGYLIALTLSLCSCRQNWILCWNCCIGSSVS